MPSVPESGNGSVVESKPRPNALKLPEAAKYTDVTRTSSASFKPPMSKDPVLKKKADVPQADSSWFGPLSYIKNMFGGKPAAESSNQVTSKIDKNKKIPTTKNTSNVSKPHVAEAKEEIEEVALVSEEHTQPSVVSEPVAPAAPAKIEHSPRFSFTPDGASGRRVVKEKVVTKKVEPEEEIDPNAPKYNALRFVENKSTYLHTPDKKGTTSFRITTSSKVKTKPNPALMSPNFGNAASKRMRRSPAMSRQSSASPKKIPQTDSTTNFPTRLRSKSTPDHASIKPRPPYNPPQKKRRRSSPRSKTPPRSGTPPRSQTPPRKKFSTRLLRSLTPPKTDLKDNRTTSLPAAQIKTVASWYDFERRGRRRMATHDTLGASNRSPFGTKSNVETVSEQKVRIGTDQEKLEKPASTTTFFSNLIKGGTSRSNTDNSDKKSREISPTRKAIESAFESAMDALSTKISSITKSQESPEISKHSESNPSPQKGKALSKGQAEKKQPEPESGSDDSILKYTMTKLSSLLEEKWSPLTERKMKKEPLPPPVVNEEPEINHKRPKDHYAYLRKDHDRHKTNKMDIKGNRSFSSSPVKKTTSKQNAASSMSALNTKPSFHDVLKSPSARNVNNNPKDEKNSFKSTLGMFSSLVQERLMPNLLPDTSTSTQSQSSSSDDKQNKFPYYAKKQQQPNAKDGKKQKGNSKTVLTASKSPNDPGKSPTISKKVGGTFLKSRQDNESMSRGHPNAVSRHSDSPPKMTISPFNRKHGI